MNSRLVWIAAVSLGISLACWSIAGLSSAMGWVHNGRPWALLRSCAPRLWAKNNGEPRTVDLAWQGSDAITINIPAQVYYQPGPKAEANVTGDSELASHVRMRGGTLGWDTPLDCISGGDLVVHLTGPAVTAWTLNGSGTLELSDIKQDAMRIVTRGSGTVIGNGEANQASVDVAGSGNVDFSKLVTRKADARIKGSADVALAPRDEVDIEIYGSAVVSLHGPVARVNSHVAGSGQIKQTP
jgi:hypothetical protein